MPTLDPVFVQKQAVQMDGDGTARVGSSRVTLDTVIAFYENGASPEEICARFPSLILSDVYGAISYFLAHRSEVQSYLQARREEAEALRSQNRASLSAGDLRTRLLERRSTAK